MNGKEKFVEEPVRREEQSHTGELAFDAEPELDKELATAIGDFRLSIHAWSEAVFSRPRTAFAEAPRSRFWRLAARWALACLLVAGVFSGGAYESLHSWYEGRSLVQKGTRSTAIQADATQATEAAQTTKTAQAEQAQSVEESVTGAQPASTHGNLMASVDKAVSREVPEAMAPLTQMMEVASTSSTDITNNTNNTNTAE